MTDASPSMPEPDPEAWVLINDELRHRMDVQRDAFGRLETKAGVVLAAAVAALQFVAREPAASYWLPLAVATYATSAAFSLLAVAPGRFNELNPRIVVIGPWYWKRHMVAGELANNRLRLIESNNLLQGDKVRRVRIAIALLLIGAMMSAAHLTRGQPTDVERRDPGGTCSPADPDRPCAAP